MLITTFLLLCHVSSSARAETIPAPPIELPDRDALIEDLLQRGAPAERAEAEADSVIEGIQFDRDLAWRQGEVRLAGGRVTLTVPPGFRYLGPKGADRVSQAWGNPPDMEAEGLIAPADLHVFSPEAWAVFLSYEQGGHVDDAEAARMDYDELLAELQAGAREQSELREAEGYGSMELLGWATPPHYDPVHRRLHWAQRLRFSHGTSGDILNYDVRLLGRAGHLSMYAVARIDLLDEVIAGMEPLLGAVRFNEGHTYEDFDPEVDELAAYGLGALVVGKTASKLGLGKGLLAVLVAGKKLIPLALAGLLAAAKGLFGRSGAP